MYTIKKLTNESAGKPEKKFDAAFGTTFKISKHFQISKQKLHNDFNFTAFFIIFPRPLELLSSVIFCDFTSEKQNIRLKK